jgi:hypothetical protein
MVRTAAYNSGVLSIYGNQDMSLWVKTRRSGGLKICPPNCPPRSVFFVLTLNFYTKIFAL